MDFGFRLKAITRKRGVSIAHCLTVSVGALWFAPPSDRAFRE
jgi:hypothetical protein